MKKEELLEIGLTEEQAAKVFAMNGKDVENAKSKLPDQKSEIERLKADLADRDATIGNLEKASGDAETTRKELERYKQEEADRKKAEKEAETDRILTEAAEQALDGKEFVNEFTRNHFVAELKKAIADPANKGKQLLGGTLRAVCRYGPAKKVTLWRSKMKLFTATGPSTPPTSTQLPFI